MGVTGEPAMAEDAAEARRDPRRKWWFAVGVLGLVAVGVLAKGTFVATATTIVITPNTPAAAGAVVWGDTTCGTHRPYGVLASGHSYVTQVAEEYGPMTSAALPAGDKVRRTRRWFHPDQYAFLATSGEVIPLHEPHGHGFSEVSCL
jgi:hypothetical protein